MSDGTIKRLAGPGYLAGSSANVYTPPASTMFIVINQIHIANTTNSTKTFSLYIGATGASSGGTEIEKDFPIPANRDWQRSFFPGIKMTSSDFLVGSASAASSLVVTVMGTQGVV
jgi:hypothetical protein